MSRAALVLGGYIVSFLFVGRPNTSYWGLLYAPLLAIGLALSPLSLRDLIARAWSPRPTLPALIALEHIWNRTAGRAFQVLRGMFTPSVRRSAGRRPE